MDNFRIAKAMTTIKKECASLDGQCDMGAACLIMKMAFVSCFRVRWENQEIGK